MQDKITVPMLRARKAAGPKIVVLTAYDATMARLLDEGGADILMVGDSLGMVVQGQPTTLGVTLDEMIYHTRLVVRGRQRAHVVSDMPFMSFQVSVEDTLRAAGRLVKEGGAEAVKLEGGEALAPRVRALVEAGIPVMGHLGLTPQSVNALGGFHVQAKSSDEQAKLMADARALRDAGVYSLVLEAIPSELATRVTEALDIPTIGIGAGPGCDGQVLVSYDFLGLFREFKPKFVKRYADLGDVIVQATTRFAQEVRSGAFPDAAHSFATPRPVADGLAAARPAAEGVLAKSAGYGPSEES